MLTQWQWTGISDEVWCLPKYCWKKWSFVFIKLRHFENVKPSPILISWRDLVCVWIRFHSNLSNSCWDNLAKNQKWWWCLSKKKNHWVKSLSLNVWMNLVPVCRCRDILQRNYLTCQRFKKQFHFFTTVHPTDVQINYYGPKWWTSITKKIRFFSEDPNWCLLN